MAMAEPRGLVPALRLFHLLLENVAQAGAAGGIARVALDRRLLFFHVLRLHGEREGAVLAVDPSSTFSGGALLGDRIRMQ